MALPATSLSLMRKKSTNPAQQVASARRREATRIRMVRSVFVIYWLLIFEGALRKWGIPELELALFFSRVPVALWLYWTAFSHRCWPTRYMLLTLSYGFSALAFVLIFLQIILGGYSLQYFLIAGYGWINYFFYAPLAFIIAEQFRSADIYRLFRHTFWLAIIATPLVFLQFQSAANSIINTGFSENTEATFASVNSALGRIRPTGFFTSTAGQQLFVVSTLTFVLYAWMVPTSRIGLNPALRISVSIAVLIMIALSQSRGLFFSAGLVILSVLIGGAISNNARLLFRMWLWPTILICSMMVIWPLLFPDALDSFLARWDGADKHEQQTFALGVFGRAFYGFYSFIYYIDETPILGYLVGLGGNAASRLAWVQFPDVAYYWNGYGGWAEGAWPRHIIELGIPIGTAFIVFRIVLTIWLGLTALKSLKISGDPLSILLWGFIGIVILNQPFTGHGTINGYAWIFLGLVLAAAKIPKHAKLSANTHRTSIRQQQRYCR